MQIDFHHGATYVIARYSGFTHVQAQTIAYAAQHVDDAKSHRFIRFDNGMRYKQHATAHPLISADNINNDANAVCWLPFHFIPGNQPCARHEDGHASRLVCRPDSDIARRMMAAVRADRHRPEALHRLGIAAHVFVDTFSHQGFAGLHHPINRASDLRNAHGAALKVVGVPPIGHGQVGVYPDIPYLRWSYVDATGMRIHRDNPSDYAAASNRLCEEFQRFRNAPVHGLSRTQRKALSHLFTSLNVENSLQRHQAWLDRIASGWFDFGPDQLSYDADGAASWKTLALAGQEDNVPAVSTTPPYAGHLAYSKAARHQIWMRMLKLRVNRAAGAIGMERSLNCRDYAHFAASDYRRFNDAARRQRHAVLYEILPEFGILMA